MVICMRIGEGAKCETRNGGWLHILRERDYRPAPRIRRVAVAAAPMPALAERVHWWQQCLTIDRRETYAAALGVDPAALGAYAVGWAQEYKAFAHPMRDHTGRITGVRLRAPDGRKWSVRGGHEGVFLPHYFLPSFVLPLSDAWYITEGATDVLAAYSIGLDCLGRPSCSGGVQTLTRMVRQGNPGRVVIVADGDAPGIAGATKLAHVLMFFCRDVRIIMPSNGRKDLRDWIQAGATACDIHAAAEAALVKKYTVISRYCK